VSAGVSAGWLVSGALMAAACVAPCVAAVGVAGVVCAYAEVEQSKTVKTPRALRTGRWLSCGGIGKGALATTKPACSIIEASR